MSAIWGIISRNNCDAKGLFAKMESSVSEFRLDRIDKVKCGSSLFACGHQYLNPEAENDISPISDEETNTVFCSDCFLFNRDSLIKELDDNSLTSAGDSVIAFRAYKKWGFSFVEKLRGRFAFVIYENNKKLLHLFSDQFSRRYTVYNCNPDYICFSTTYKPVLACLGDKARINREFICNSFRYPSPLSFYKERITPYENVFHLDYAIHVTLNVETGEETRSRYWNPRKTVKPLKLKSDNDYKKAFRDLFGRLTHSLLRSKNETGIFLSGGLDSSSVAAFSASYLQNENKKLYSYTSVPCSAFKETNPPGKIYDESSLIKMQKELHPNLEPHFVSSDNESAITNIDEYQDFFDIPIQNSINMFNIIKMSEEAHKDNCSILLTGTNGNATISYGYITDYMSLNVSGLHFIKAFRGMSEYCKYHKMSRKEFLRLWTKSICKEKFKKAEENHNYLKPEDEIKYGLTHVARDYLHNYGSTNFVNKRQHMNFVLFWQHFIQGGFYYTYLGLKNHFIQLDPTLTVEMIEFCMSIPMECYVYNGIERRLVRDYLKDLLPGAITDMYSGRGVQSADYDYRINRDFNICKTDILKHLDEPLLRDYLDREKIDKKTAELKEAASQHGLTKIQCVELALLAYLGSFLRSRNKS